MSHSRSTSVHRLFEDQALRAPGSPALVVPSSVGGESARTISYSELDRRASEVAARLRSGGVKPGDFVAILMSRSAETIVAMLATLKAGGAYMPLDPAYPRDRLEFMVADSGARVCLTQELLADRAGWPGVQVMVIDAKAGHLESGPVASEDRPPDAPAYVLYTSGSTGKPKGVVVPHRGIVRLVRGTAYARLDSSRAILQLASTSFDAATFEIWGALLNGGRSVLAPETGVTDLPRLKRAIHEAGVTTVLLTTTPFNMIVDQAPRTFETVDEVLIGGEALSVAHIRKATDLLPATQFINGYGPTESTTFACCYRIPRPVPADWPSIPIGPAIANTTALVMDEQLRPVSDGQVGELCIGGDGLALGYLNRPELTAERFVVNPADGVSRLYRTGDRARVLPDGAIEFLGRLDDQVKVRGHRVELGEIESALRDVTGVGSAVVALREDLQGEKHLVAYYTPGDCEGSPSGATLRKHLVSRLPEYMVPSHFVLLSTIPLTPNGKADRGALPAPGRRRPALDKPAVAPRTPLETWLADLWKTTLDLEEVGVDDRFFDLGGTSITAMHLLAQINRETEGPLPALLLFRAGTVRELAAILDREYRAQLPSGVRGRDGPATATGAAERAMHQRDELSLRRMKRRLGS